uniref:Uncharacterized protein n=1 Tax=Arundo donax TaxID=35708 RepID=A0A0A9FWK6_ARUDO
MNLIRSASIAPRLHCSRVRLLNPFHLACLV